MDVGKRDRKREYGDIDIVRNRQSDGEKEGQRDGQTETTRKTKRQRFMVFLLTHELCSSVFLTSEYVGR